MYFAAIVYNNSRNACNCDVVRDIFVDHRISSDFHIIADYDVAENFSSSPYENIVSHFGTFAFFFADNHTTLNYYIFPTFNFRINYYANTMENYQTPAKLNITADDSSTKKRI